MADDFDAQLGATWRDARPGEFLTRLTELGSRLGGHPGEAEAADLVAEEFDDAGVAEVSTATFGMSRWNRGAATLRVTAPVEREFETAALPYCPPGEIEGPIVDVGYGTEAEIEAADLEGAVAVASTMTPPDRRFVHRMEKFGMAVEAGAEAFVFANHVEGQLPPTGALRFDAEAEMPGVGVSKETGAWLRAYADPERSVPADGTAAFDGPRDGAGRVRVTVDAGTEPGESRNVVGRLAPDAGGDEIVAVAHFDAHDVAEGALDNGCGIAVLTALARILSGIEDDLERPVTVAGVGCEELGLMGSEALADSIDRDGVHAVVNLDGVGRFRDLRALTHTSDAIESLVEDVADESGHPIGVRADPHPYSDHWPFLRDGVPSLQLHSDSDERGRGWGHTAADTRDKVDPRNLRSHAMLAALLVRELAAADLPRIDVADLRETLRENGHESGMRAAEVWPGAWEDA